MTEADSQTRDQSVTTAPEPTLVERARERATKALETTRTGARDVADKAADGVASAPLVVVAGGIAAGAIAGLLIPRSEREAQLLGPIGQKLNEGAATAARAARDAGKAELAAVGLSRVGASEQMGKLVEGVAKAVSSAGNAAKESRKRKSEQDA